MRDLERGRLFLVAPDGHQYQSPKVDVSKIDGAIAALKSLESSYAILGLACPPQAGQESRARLAKTLG